MIAKTFCTCIIFIFALSCAVFAQDGKFKLSGSVAVEGIYTTDEAKDAAKLHEYRDLYSGPLGAFELRGRGKRFYLDAFGENLGRDNMYVNVEGGVYGRFHFRVYGDWLKHIFGLGPNGARTPYQDPGSRDLQLFSTIPATLTNSSVPPWASFNFQMQRRDVGGNFELSGSTPWYVLIETNDVYQSGINKVDAAALGISPINGFIDLPYPVSYTTRNVSVEGGYQKPRGHISGNAAYSSFDNDHHLLSFQNPFFGFGQDTATFAPDNSYVRLGASGMLRQLPLNSTLSGHATYERGTDAIDMITEVLNTFGSSALTPTNPSSPVFHGKVENTTFQISFASELARHLDTRVYYKYYKRNNTSTAIEFEVPLTTIGMVCAKDNETNPIPLSVFCAATRYGYSKYNPGAEAGYRVTHGNRLSAGFDYLHTNRNRFDANTTRDQKAFVQWSNSSLDFMTARFKYQFLQRRSDFLTNNSGFNANSRFFLERYNRSFDVENLNQHLIKADIDISPIKFLDFGFEAYYKRNNFRDFVLGRVNDRRKEFYGSISYGNPDKFRVTLFSDVEFINYDSYHRTINVDNCPSTAPNCFDPTTDPTTTAFNWGAKLKDKNWTVEFGADWHLTTHFALKGSVLEQETRGSVDFQSQTLADGTPATLLFPIGAYDNTKRRSINPRAVYIFTNTAELTIGYAYERYEYKDTQFEGYQYTIGSDTTTSYLSGIYAFPDYRANIAYATLRYIF